MHYKATIRAATSSYLGSASAAITGLLSIKLATHFLSQEEFGLWSFTMQTIGYFMLMDLGVSNSVARLFGEPLGSGDPQKINSWFTLSLATLASQALLILGMGLLLRPYVLEWFNIPAHLLDQASDLWLAFLVIQAVSLVFKLSFAILHAQNRVYWTSNLQIIGSWMGLAAFFLMLSNHWGVMAYAWSAGVAMLVTSIGGILAVRRSDLRFKISIAGVTRAEVRTLFGFSSSVFVLAIAWQVYFASQGLVATKLLGLEAAAVLAVTGRATAIAMQSIWKPFDAFSPRWQVAYCAGDHSKITSEFRVMTRFTILLAAVAAIGVALVNQPFVLWWTKPGYFGGISLSLLLCVFMLIQGINRCFIAPFTMTLKMRIYTWVNIASVGSAVLLMIGFTKWFGLVGIPMGLILADLMFPMWFYLIKGGGCVRANGFRILGTDLLLWFPLLGTAFLISMLLDKLNFNSNLIWLLCSLACAATLTAPILWRAISLLRQLKCESSAATKPIEENDPAMI
jgi:O-antigen/teichoic acid export membrane protein